MRTRLFVLLMVLCSTISFSYADVAFYPRAYFRYGGLCYYPTSDSTVEVRSSIYSDIDYKELTSVIIPETVTYEDYHKIRICSVTSIGSSAFKGCTGLTSITIPNSVTKIDAHAFKGCTGLTTIAVEIGNTKYDSREDCNAIIETASKTLILGCRNTVIPNSVTTIGYEAFKGCTGLTSITIPNSVMYIGMYAFEGCTGLTTIVVESGNTKYDSREDCNAIIETATLILGCRNTIIPNSVTNIGYEAFKDCTGLTSITIPKNVTEVGRDAFRDCTGLSSISFRSFRAPRGCEVSDTVAFRGCSSLMDVYIPCGAQSYDKAWDYYYRLQEDFLFELTVATEDSTSGTVNIDKPVTCKDIEAVISAVPYTDCRFWKWDDGNTDNPRTIRLTEDVSHTAFFDKKCKIDVIYDSSMGTVSGIGSYFIRDTAILEAKAKEGYKFSHWDNGRTNPRNYFTVTEDRTLEAFFIPRTAVEDVKADKAYGVQKILRDGQVLILRNGKTYTLMGTKIR